MPSAGRSCARPDGQGAARREPTPARCANLPVLPKPKTVQWSTSPPRAHSALLHWKFARWSTRKRQTWTPRRSATAFGTALASCARATTQRIRLSRRYHRGIQQTCACDLLNPQGPCCLGNLRRWLRSAPAGQIGSRTKGASYVQADPRHRCCGLIFWRLTRRGMSIIPISFDDKRAAMSGTFSTALRSAS